jgi:hypothetical protein
VVEPDKRPQIMEGLLVALAALVVTTWLVVQETLHQLAHHKVVMVELQA